jgi:hypothetical protein
MVAGISDSYGLYLPLSYRTNNKTDYGLDRILILSKHKGTQE